MNQPRTYPLTRLLAAALFLALCSASVPAAAEVEPIRALLITGGGWHDYEEQKDILAKGIASRANVDWTVVYEGMDGDTQERASHKVRLQQEPGWEDGFDVVVYNICFSYVTDVDFIEGIVKVHEEGLAAVVLHCAIHSFRDAETDAWRNLLGIDSRRHEARRPFTVENLAPDHPVMKESPAAWTTPKGELYMMENVHDGVTPLARAYGLDTDQHHLTVWTNDHGEGRVFGTTIGHHNETMAADEYLDMVTRGLLWATGKLRKDGTPAAGYSRAGDSRKRLVMVAGEPSHGRGTHEHNAGVRLLKKGLKNVPGLDVVAHYNGWPADSAAFEGADGVLLYMDGGGSHPVLRDDRLQQIQALMDDGVGLAAFHYATEVPKARGGPEFLDWIGGYYETHYSANPIWTADFNELPDHPITRGVEPFSIEDEWYFSLSFREEMSGITPVLQAAPSDETRDGPYVHPRGPYPHIVKAKGQAETLAWATERDDGGRGFGFTGGHFHKNWKNEHFRTIALNALVWITGADVPAEGVASTVTPEDLEENLD